MEEDMNILEDLNENLKQRPLNCDVYIREDDRQALENLTKAYKELEETLKCTQNSWYEDTKIIENSIPKSKVKEKIEELEEEKQCFYSDYAIEERNNKIQVLEELLKGDDK